jgi:hypothetical protein
MKCKEVEKRLPAYVDGELDAAVREVVKTHLNLCPACSLAYDAMKKTLAAARHWRARPLPEGFTETVRERAERGDTPRPVSVGFRVPVVPRLAWQIGAACLILLGGLVLGRLLWPRQVERIVVEHVGAAGAREQAVETIATLQKLKLVLSLRRGTEQIIAEQSAIQRRLAEAVGPVLARQVAAYQRAEALIAEGRLDEAELILAELEAAHPPFVLAPYVRITRLAARAVKVESVRTPAELLLPEVLATPERLYAAIAKYSRQVAGAYTEALERGLGAFRPETEEQPHPEIQWGGN